MKHYKYLSALFLSCLICISCNTEKKDFLKDYGDFVSQVELLAANEDVSTYTELENSKTEFEERYNLISSERPFSSEEKSQYARLTQRYKTAKKSLDKSYIKSEAKRTGESLLNGLNGFLDSLLNSPEENKNE